jgi:hypothetical protein
MISEQDLSQIFWLIDEWPQLSRDQQIKFNELCRELDEAARDARSTLPPGAREYIKKLVDAAPPLTEEQKARLRVLLWPDLQPAAPLTKKALQERLRQRTKDWPPLTAEQRDILTTLLRRTTSSSQNP